MIEYLVKGQKTGQLFNLKSDPWEIENLYEVQEFDSKKIELQNELQKQLTKYNDQVVLSSEYWNVKPISSWIKKVSPSTIDKLRKLAQRDRELRGFFETAK